MVFQSSIINPKGYPRLKTGFPLRYNKHPVSSIQYPVPSIHEEGRKNHMTGLMSVFNRIDGYRDEIIQLQRNLTARVALGPDNGGQGEHEKTSYINGLLEALKPDILQEIKAPDERAHDGYRPNLIAKWEGRQKDRIVWVLSHSDIVPPGDPSLWESEPYEVIGVMPADFNFADGQVQSQFWLPVGINPESANPGSFTFDAIARLKPGATVEAADAQMVVLVERVRERWADAPMFINFLDAGVILFVINFQICSYEM